MPNQFTPLVNPPFQPSEAAISRFSQAAWFDFVKHQQILVAGCGGIGSWLVFMLARLNPARLYVMDDDIVELANMAGQLFRRSDVSNSKIYAVKNICQDFANYPYIDCIDGRLTENTSIAPILMCGFDNMTARRDAFTAWCRKLARVDEEDKKKFLFIDGRLSAETLQVFCITGEDDYYMQEYRRHWLFSDAEAESVVCSYKQTTYCANLIASLMTNLFVNWCTNQCDPLIPRSLPFMTEYTAEQMFLKTEV